MLDFIYNCICLLYLSARCNTCVVNLNIVFSMMSLLAARDYVKFNFPAAQAMTTLAWGGIIYEQGYKCAGEYENLLAAVKWGTDYFIKCHVSDYEYYAQVFTF